MRSTCAASFRRKIEVEPQAYDANSYLEVLPTMNGFAVWLFDYQIGEGDTIGDALEDAKQNVRRWVEQ